MAARNRPRGTFAKEDIADELNLWNSIVEKIRKCNGINKHYEEIAQNVPLAEAKLEDTTAAAETVTTLDELEKLHRNGLKYAEEEIKILNEEPDDLIKNLETLISVRAAFEAEAPGPRSNAPTSKPRNLKRRLDADSAGDSPAPDGTTPPVHHGHGTPSRMVSKANSRSGSVAASSSVKSEEDNIKPVAYERREKFPVGSEVFFKNKGKVADGEGILCSVTSILGEGKQRRYEVQDPEPDENGNLSGPYKATAAFLIAVPPLGAPLPDLPKGKQVVAVYPDTSTFYKAEVVGTRKDFVRLRFEGEEEKGKEQDVERRYVLEKT